MTRSSVSKKVLLCIFLFVYFGEIINYYLKPSVLSILTGAGLAVPTTCAFTMVLSLVLYKDLRSRGWYCLTASLMFFAIGAVINYSYQTITGSLPFPGPADVSYLLVYPAAIIGLAFFIKENSKEMILAGSAFSIIIASLVFGVLSYPVLISSTLDTKVSVFTKIVYSAYPTADVFLLGMVVFTMFLSIMRKTGEPSIIQFVFLMVGLSGFIIGDTFYDYASLHWVWYQPSSEDIGWFAFFGSWPLAMLYSKEMFKKREVNK